MFLAFWTYAQKKKVTLVLSGGGAKGLAHIGVLKYLEENKVPVNAIVGTSMGGLVGGFYAAGYTPAEMEAIAASSDFKNWSSGKIDERFNNYYLRKEENASVVGVAFNIDTTLRPSIKPILVNDAPLNLAISRYLSMSTAITKNFDSLVVPFRCLAADVYSQSKIVLKNGYLSEALRATMSVPLFFQPFKINGRFVYDGGIYDNFPIEVAKKEFKSDMVLGVNVSTKTFTDYPYNNDDAFMSKSLIFMLFAKSDSTLLGETGVYVQPKLEGVSTMDFHKADIMIKAGYEEAKRKFEKLLPQIQDTAAFKLLEERRRKFKVYKEPSKITGLKITGLESHQERFVFNTIRERKRDLGIDRFTLRYYRIVQDGNFNILFPLIRYDSISQGYTAELKIARSRTIDLELGGNIATRALQQLYLGYSYGFINRLSFNLYGNFYTGRFYHSVQTKLRIILPLVKQPLYLEPEFTWNQWDYLRMNEILVKENVPTYIRQSDVKAGLTLGMPIRSRLRLLAQFAYFELFDRYNNDITLANKDTLDLTKTEGFYPGLTLDMYNMDKKMYPTVGTSFSVSGKYIFANEMHTPGSSSLLRDNYSKSHQWLKIKVRYEQLVPIIPKFSAGYMAEAVFSNQPTFRNYTSTLIQSSAFTPMQDSKTLFLENFRGFQYTAGGLKLVYKTLPKLHLRVEGFFFQRYNKLEILDDQTANSSFFLESTKFCGNVNLVYWSPFGPVSLSGIYYDDPKKQYGILLHIGYILFNNRPLD